MVRAHVRLTRNGYVSVGTHTRGAGGGTSDEVSPWGLVVAGLLLVLMSWVSQFIPPDPGYTQQAAMFARGMRWLGLFLIASGILFLAAQGIGTLFSRYMKEARKTRILIDEQEQQFQQDLQTFALRLGETRYLMRRKTAQYGSDICAAQFTGGQHLSTGHLRFLIN